MGVRALVAAGLVAAGLWAAPASATVYHVDLTYSGTQVKTAVIDFDPITLVPGDSAVISLNLFDPQPLSGFPFLFAVMAGEAIDYTNLSKLAGVVELNCTPRLGCPDVIGRNDIKAYLVPATVTITYTGPRFSGDGVTFDRAVFASSVPEPATWAMMLVGLASIPLIRRRHAAPIALR